MIYQVGKQFHIDQDKREEGIYPIFTNGSFDLVVIMGEVSEDTIKIFNNDKTTFGAVQLSHIPFMTIRFKKSRLKLACYINVYKLNPLNVDAWLKLNVAKRFNIYLVEQKKGILISTRTIFISVKFIKEIKKILAQQHQHYTSIEQVDAIGGEVFKNQARKMIQQWKYPSAMTTVNSEAEMEEDNRPDEVL